MEIMVIVALIIGLILGGITVWVYRNSKADKNNISFEDYEAVKTSLQQSLTEAAVAKGRLSEVEKEFDQAKGVIDQIRTSEQQSLREQDIMKTVKDNALTRLSEITGENKETEEQLKQKSELLNTANNAIARLEEEVKSRDERLKTQKQDFEEIKGKLEKEFKVIAGSILDNSSQKFHEQQSNHLKTILDPLKENINSFKTEIISRYNDENKDRASLRTEIKQVV